LTKTKLLFCLLVIQKLLSCQIKVVLIQPTSRNILKKTTKIIGNDFTCDLNQDKVSSGCKMQCGATKNAIYLFLNDD